MDDELTPEQRAEKAAEVLVGLTKLLNLARQIKKSASKDPHDHWTFSEWDNWSFVESRLKDAEHTASKAVRRTNRIWEST